MSLMQGKTIVVVGGSSGIGLSVVEQLVGQGAEVWAASRTHSEGLQSTGAHFIPLDVTGEVDSLSAVPQTIDGLVYCPGTINLRPFKALKIVDFQHDLEVNLLGAVKVLQYLMKNLRNPSGSSVVLFSTVAVAQGMSFHASIAAAKGAVEGLGKSLAAELAPQGTRVNVIAPSLTDTPLAGSLLATPEKRDAAAKRHPLQKIGTADDLASMAVFLLSPQSAWMTGQVLHFDGGISSVKSF